MSIGPYGGGFSQDVPLNLAGKVNSLFTLLDKIKQAEPVADPVEPRDPEGRSRQLNENGAHSSRLARESYQDQAANERFLSGRHQGDPAREGRHEAPRTTTGRRARSHQGNPAQEGRHEAPGSPGRHAGPLERVIVDEGKKVAKAAAASGLAKAASAVPAGRAAAVVAKAIKIAGTL